MEFRSRPPSRNPHISKCCFLPASIRVSVQPPLLRLRLQLVRSHPRVLFSVVGPDEGEGQAVTQLLAAQDNPLGIRREGALDPTETLDRLRDCAIYVLPAVNEPFPMSVLEAMSVGKPVIVTETCGLATFIQQTNSGLVVDDSTESLAIAIQDSARQLRAAKQHGRERISSSERSLRHEYDR